MFKGLSAFPLTPLSEAGIDFRAFAGLVERLADSDVDSMGVLGSTGSYAYLEKHERKRALREALAHAGGVPVIAGIGALRTAMCWSWPWTPRMQVLQACCSPPCPTSP